VGRRKRLLPLRQSYASAYFEFLDRSLGTLSTNTKHPAGDEYSSARQRHPKDLRVISITAFLFLINRKLCRSEKAGSGVTIVTLSNESGGKI
jgi:hypothetical protein